MMLLCFLGIYFAALLSICKVSGSDLSNILNSGGSENSTSLLDDWVPIHNSISAGETNYYSYSLGYDSWSSSFDFLFISGNLLNIPNTNGSVLRLYYSFSDTIFANLSDTVYEDFYDGYVSAMVSTFSDTATDLNTTYSTLYLALQVVDQETGVALVVNGDSNSDDTWDYQIAVSEKDLYYQWDRKTWIEVMDTDYNSVLLSIGQFVTATSAKSNSTSSDEEYVLYIYTPEEAEKITANRNCSISAVKNGPHIISSENVTESDVDLSLLDREDFQIFKLNVDAYTSNNHGQYYITGLNSSTSYVGFLTQTITGSNGSSDENSSGGLLYGNFTFSTKPDNTCSLVFGLNFCSGVAYSVPTPSELQGNKSAIVQIYDSIAESLYTNFTKALQIIPCDTELDARYSPLRTCDDCAASYLDWLCAVSIPRCTTTETPHFIYRNKNVNRNSYINEDIKPIRDYYEVLPCIDMCHSIVRDCPADFGFACPEPSNSNNLLFSSYNYYYEDFDYITCNFIGNYSSLIIPDAD
ncbi:hypothetical protein TPHA_0P01210 [Tetrapisispora phaffii CBS 4417]|uniref:FZ domain-containing protein n=1 Tax=Tetrapisispora phaffii (strain ATCC 24235 / CBS 4417 / NBRC 1672 / NRRL Y-8282 / UCD 70-5) TaxID=1071381 RepID=G8C2A1_TETPH|nr:hypothetical protein TPHA_0P01210 [Tetrapisispora phaffii CBS 4417]CCE66279.1 hypothetical protein TPHA_0P01210 [Tetrapisispora phaffii CBS 4417]